MRHTSILAGVLLFVALGCGGDRDGTASRLSTSAVDAPACAAQEFSKSIPSCCGLPTFYWNGQRCVDATMLSGKCGCVCAGDACDELFDTAAACEATFARCPPSSPLLGR
jgi:hypothetical protein